MSADIMRYWLIFKILVAACRGFDVRRHNLYYANLSQQLSFVELDKCFAFVVTITFFILYD